MRELAKQLDDSEHARENETLRVLLKSGLTLEQAADKMGDLDALQEWLRASHSGQPAATATPRDATNGPAGAPAQRPIFSIELPDQRVMEIEAENEATAMRGAQEWFEANGRQPAATATNTPRRPAAPPIEVEAPNGDVVEFPAGTPDATINQAMMQAYGPGGRFAGAPAQRPSWWQRQRDMVTGELRTEFPNAEEFRPAYTRAQGDIRSGAPIMQSAVTPDEAAQIDILRSRIPGLETRRDAHGNLMLKAPGMPDWAYLNKPGASARDLDEVATQVGATALAFSPVGLGRTLLARMGIAAAAGGAASVEQDVLATAAGSEQGIDPIRAGVSAAIGAPLAPGVPSSIVSTGANIVKGATAPVTNFVRGITNPEREASRRVGTALGRDQKAGVAQIGPADEAFAAASGQPLMTADFGGDTTRALARSAANTSPEARGTLDRAINQRFETQADRAGQFLTQLVGPPANAHAIGGAIARHSQANVGPAYTRALQSGRNGIWHPDFDDLSQAAPFQEAMRAAERSLGTKEAAGTMQTGATGSWGAPSLEYWDQVKRQLDDRVTSLRQSGEREAARDMIGLRERLLRVLDASFHDYAAARRTAAGYFQAEDALEAGERFAMQRFDLNEARQAVTAMSPNEQIMFRQGYASRLLDQLNNTADRRSIVTQVTGSKSARDKLEIALGPQAAREMEAFMRIESLMDLMRGAMGNSTTARQLMELGLAGGAGLAISGGDFTNPNAWMTAGLVWGSRRGLIRVDERVVRHVADKLVSQDPAVRQQAIRQVAHTPILSGLRALDEAFTGAARGAAGMQLVPAPSEDRR